MAGRIGNHERAPRRCKKPVGDIDRDALFALGLEAVEQERKIDVVFGSAVALRVSYESGKLIFENQLSIMQ